jgi:hypothetical protein
MNCSEAEQMGILTSCILHPFSFSIGDFGETYGRILVVLLLCVFCACVLRAHLIGLVV